MVSLVLLEITWANVQQFIKRARKGKVSYCLISFVNYQTFGKTWSHH